jgi:hypothetical protein
MDKRIKDAVAGWEPEWQERFTERAGVREFEGGARRPIAEQLAFLELSQERRNISKTTTRGAA